MGRLSGIPARRLLGWWVCLILDIQPGPAHETRDHDREKIAAAIMCAPNVTGSAPRANEWHGVSRAMKRPGGI